MINLEINVNTLTESYGSFRLNKSLPSTQSYARSVISKAEFAVAIMPPNQMKDDDTEILYPSLLWVNCKSEPIQFNLMEKLSSEESKRVAPEAVQLHESRFYLFHKQIFTHSRLWINVGYYKEKSPSARRDLLIPSGSLLHSE